MAIATEIKQSMSEEIKRQQRVHPYEMIEAGYVDDRVRAGIRQYERAIEHEKQYIEQIKDRIRPKEKEKIEWKIQMWGRQLDRLKSGEWKKVNTNYLHEQYAKMLKKAISTGQPVPQHIINQAPEYKAAQNARERYEKGWKTSFANRSVAINDQMKEELGYKVKRQDGKPITSEQLDEIAKGVGEVEKAIGPLHDLFDKTDITMVHTSGKHPFLSGFGGTYTPQERAVNVGVEGTRALGHELGHWLDHEAGKSKGLSTRLWGKTGHKSYESTSAAEATQLRYRGGDETPLGKLLREATANINNIREVRDLMKADYGKNLSAEDKTQAKVIRERLSPYWREPREVWARLVEQYMATKNAEGGVAADHPSFYEKRPGWWTREDFARMMPVIESEIRTRLRSLRGSDVVPPRKSATAKKKLQEFAGNVKQIEQAIPIKAPMVPPPAAPAAGPTKELWQMTREEFQKGKLRYLGPSSVAEGHRPAGVASRVQQSEITQAKRLGLHFVTLPDGQTVYGKTQPDVERLASYLKAGGKDPELSKQLGYTDEDRANLQEYGYEAHKTVIAKALKEGKPVPAEVLKDYPELGKKPKPEAKPSTESREPWKMTKSEFVKQATVSDKDVGTNKVYVTWDNGSRGDIAEGVSQTEAPKEVHRMAIAYAVSKGKTVPSEVLKDYPELGKAKEAKAEPEKPKEPPKHEGKKPEPKAKPERVAQGMLAAEAQKLIDKIQKSRTSHAVAMDNSRKAGRILSLSKAHIWARKPNRCDIRGVDTPTRRKLKKPRAILYKAVVTGK